MSWTQEEWNLVGKPVVDRAKLEIACDIAARRVPSTVASFAELHDHVDANGYGGAFEEEWDGSDENLYFWNRVQNELHEWLAAGQHRLGLK